MENVVDPFNDARDEVNRLFKDADTLVTHLRSFVPYSTSEHSLLKNHTTNITGLQRSSSDADCNAGRVLRELTQICSELNENISHLLSAVNILEQQTMLFHVDTLELSRRKEYVQSWIRRLHSMDSEILSLSKILNISVDQLVLRDPPVSSSSGCEPNCRQIDPIRSIRKNLTPEGSYSTYPDKILSDKEECQNSHGDVNGELMNQQILLELQDTHLEDVHRSVKRLGQVGIAISDELAVQDRLLEELEDATTTVQYKLKHVQKQLDGVVQDLSNKHKICIIITLLLVLTILIYVLVSG